MKKTLTSLFVALASLAGIAATVTPQYISHHDVTGDTLIMTNVQFWVDGVTNEIIREVSTSSAITNSGAVSAANDYTDKSIQSVSNKIPKVYLVSAGKRGEALYLTNSANEEIVYQPTDTKRDLTNNVCAADSFTEWSATLPTAPSGGEWERQPFYDTDNAEWRWNYTDWYAESGNSDPNATSVTFYFTDFEVTTTFPAIRAKAAYSNDTFTTYGFVTSAVAHVTITEADPVWTANSNSFTTAMKEYVNNFTNYFSATNGYIIGTKSGKIYIVTNRVDTANSRIGSLTTGTNNTVRVKASGSAYLKNAELNDTIFSAYSDVVFGGDGYATVTLNNTEIKSTENDESSLSIPKVTVNDLIVTNTSMGETTVTKFGQNVDTSGSVYVDGDIYKRTSSGGYVSENQVVYSVKLGSGEAQHGDVSLIESDPNVPNWAKAATCPYIEKYAPTVSFTAKDIVADAADGNSYFYGSVHFSKCPYFPYIQVNNITSTVVKSDSFLKGTNDVVYGISTDGGETYRHGNVILSGIVNHTDITNVIRELCKDLDPDTATASDIVKALRGITD